MVTMDMVTGRWVAWVWTAAVSFFMAGTGFGALLVRTILDRRDRKKANNDIRASD